MKKTFSLLLALVVSVSACLAGCAGPKETNLFGESIDTALEYYGLTKEDGEKSTEPEDVKAAGMHYDSYTFENVPFGDIEAAGMMITEGYYIDASGNRNELGIITIQYSFAPGDYADAKAFRDAVTPILQKDKRYHAYDAFESFYNSTALTDAEWKQLAENTQYQKSTLGTGYTMDETEKPMIAVQIGGIPNMIYTASFSGTIFTAVKHPETMQAIAAEK